MVTLGYEQPVAMPSMGIYDTDLMKMYISGLKDQYDTNIERIDKYLDKYSDFTSSVNGAAEMYRNASIGRVKDMIEDYAKNGVDMFKSPEGSLAINRIITGTDTALLNNLKKEAEIADRYEKSIDELKSKQLFDQGFEDFINGGKSLKNWDHRNGFWNISSATPYTGTYENTAKYFEGIKDSYLGNDGRFMKSGVDRKRMKDILDDNFQDILSNPAEKYNFMKFGEQYKNAHPDANNDKIKDAYYDYVVDLHGKHLHVDYAQDPYKATAYAHSFDRQPSLRTNRTSGGGPQEYENAYSALQSETDALRQHLSKTLVNNGNGLIGRDGTVYAGTPITKDKFDELSNIDGYKDMVMRDNKNNYYLKMDDFAMQKSLIEIYNKDAQNHNAGFDQNKFLDQFSVHSANNTAKYEMYINDMFSQDDVVKNVDGISYQMFDKRNKKDLSFNTDSVRNAYEELYDMLGDGVRVERANNKSYVLINKQRKKNYYMKRTIIIPSSILSNSDNSDIKNGVEKILRKYGLEGALKNGSVRIPVLHKYASYDYNSSTKEWEIDPNFMPKTNSQDATTHPWEYYNLINN